MKEKIFEVDSKATPVFEQISDWLGSLENLTTITIQFNDTDAKVYYEEKLEEE
ncbi:hypothetical protein ACERII_13430 [Evansella sp. AB-rgal1]|uniref:hypothetical protein n=1 Tax=Evansella sp. AB-rgal1 TaxID=3242696 RepID=UPI00359D57E0